MIDRAKLPNRFAELYPAVREYVATRAWRSTSTTTRYAPTSLGWICQEGVAKCLARKIGELTIEQRAIEFDKADFRLSETKPV